MYIIPHLNGAITVMKNICFISGKVDGDKVQPDWEIPYHPGEAIKEYDSYFITDNSTIYNKALESGWIPQKVKCSSKSYEEINQMGAEDRFAYYTYQSKWMKIFPEEFVERQYDYVVWSDGSYSVNALGSIKSIYNMKDTTAVMFRPHHKSNTIQQELDECLSQERYQKQEYGMRKYIQEEIDKGKDAYNTSIYYGGYIIYNLSHPKIKDFRTTWLEHIHRCGIEDQISLGFVSQKFKDIIEDYTYDTRSAVQTVT